MRLRRIHPRHPACRLPAALAVAGVILCAILTGCGGPRVPDRGPGGEATREETTWPGATADQARAGCLDGDEAVLGGGVFQVAVTDSVLPGRAPIPHNPAERLVFAHLYETLVRVDCDGTLRPGLAAHWSSNEDHTVWVFTIREEARFWDGVRITPEEVRQAWRGNQDCPAGGLGSSPWTWFNAHARSVAVLDGRRLSVQLPEPQADFPRLLAHPATAVCARRPGWTWPVGSGCARLQANTPPPLPELVCQPNLHHPDAPSWKQLVFVCRPGSDPRDLVTGSGAEGPDLVVLDDLGGREFYDALPGYRVLALPWTRLFLLFCPPRQNAPDGLRWGRGLVAGLKASPPGLVAWQDWPQPVLPLWSGSSCPQLRGPVADRSAAPVAWNLAGLPLGPDALAYPAGVPGLEELAERVAGGAAFAPTLVPLARPPLEFVLQWQMTGAVLMAVDQEFPDGCLQLAALLGRAGWIQQAAWPEASALPDDSFAGAALRLDPRPVDPLARLVKNGWIQPLGVSHRWLAVREGLGGMTVEFDGTPWLGGLGRLDDRELP